jgi:N-glycosylase/DNA lyase
MLGKKLMKELLKLIENLKRSKVKREVDARLREFKAVGKETSKEMFKELCFCLLTAHSSAEKCIEIQKEMGNGFISLPESQLRKRLKILGHRHPNVRAKYITEARQHCVPLKKIICSFVNGREAREWLVRNVKGLGYKESSHFLRNIGFDDVAIIDSHIMDILVKHKVIKRPKTLTKNKYLEIEDALEKIARMTKLNLSELDLYLWFAETGKVLK